MIDLARIETAEWLAGLRFRLRLADGFDGVVDLAPELGLEPGALAPIHDDPAGFAIALRGRALVWCDAAGEEVDLCADMLRGLAREARAAAE